LYFIALQRQIHLRISKNINQHVCAFGIQCRGVGGERLHLVSGVEGRGENRICTGGEQIVLIEWVIWYYSNIILKTIRLVFSHFHNQATMLANE